MEPDNRPPNNPGAGNNALAIRFVEEMQLSRDATERLTGLIQQQMKMEQQLMKTRVEMHNSQMEAMQEMNQTMANWYETMVDVAQNQDSDNPEVETIVRLVTEVMRGRKHLQ